MSKRRAVPLCLPNNCKWDEQTGEYSKDGEDRKLLCVIEAALRNLRSIKGPVCVVSIAGPCRKGKSYMLSKAFDQGEVFPLGHELDPETMGIWMWIVPDKFKDTNGQEFTVVLLDSEGIGAVSSGGPDDHCIFTLTILLSSVLIYNSAGVPTRTDLDGLQHIAKLSQLIQVRSNNPTHEPGAIHDEDSAHFFKSFPTFIWLLRDVVLGLPDNCYNIKEYFISKVFKSTAEGKGEGTDDVAKGILTYFPEFHAFKLRPPSSDPEVVSNLSEKEYSDVDKLFIWGIDGFKRMLKSKLAPKRSISGVDYVTGEGLAELVISYVAELNNPGTVVNADGIWDNFVSRKCSDVKATVIRTFEQTMQSEMEGKMPCESHVIHRAHKTALDKALKLFQEETLGISAANIEKYLKETTDFIESSLNHWQQENRNLTKESCCKLLVELKRRHLEPVLTRLRGRDGVHVLFSEIKESYATIERNFMSDAKGALDARAEIFCDFQGELESEMAQYTDHLKRLKDFDENIAREKQERAREEQEKMVAKEENARLEKERATREKQMTMLKARQEEEKCRLESRFRADMAAQQERMQNLMKANMEKLQNEKQVVVDQNKALKNAIEKKQRSLNEKNNQIESLKRRI